MRASGTGEPAWSTNVQLTRRKMSNAATESVPTVNQRAKRAIVFAPRCREPTVIRGSRSMLATPGARGSSARPVESVTYLRPSKVSVIPGTAGTVRTRTAGDADGAAAAGLSEPPRATSNGTRTTAIRLTRAPRACDDARRA